MNKIYSLMRKQNPKQDGTIGRELRKLRSKSNRDKQIGMMGKGYGWIVPAFSILLMLQLFITCKIINVVGKSSKEAPDFGFIGTPEKHEGEHSRIGNMAMKELGLTNCSKGMDFFRREQGTENWGSYVTGFSVQVFELVPFYGPLPLLYFLYKVSVLGFKPNNIKKIGSIDGYPDAFGNGDIQAAFFVVPHAKAKVILAKYCALFFLFNLGLCFRSRDCGKKARPFHTGQGKRDAKVRIYIFLMNVAKLSHVGSSREILSSKQIVEGWRQHFSVI
ncbi:hypothetical protein V6N11_030261 [Hibiscus sabdariffa]|uniref:Uncharacterized protein n=1 Tax=Hibiscus sabdariffa TaxID=183260 RepID=A0ABR2PKC9_9ROSI